MFIQACYNFYGSINSNIHFVEGPSKGSIKLVTDYNETIAIIEDISELCVVLNKIKNDDYA